MYHFIVIILYLLFILSLFGGHVLSGRLIGFSTYVGGSRNVVGINDESGLLGQWSAAKTAGYTGIDYEGKVYDEHPTWVVEANDKKEYKKG